MTRVIHTGDTHIGYQQYHSPVRRQDFLDAFEQVIRDAIDEEVDAVVHAGDLFHDRRPELQDLMGTLAILRELNDANIPFLAIVGNHESTRGGQWLDLFGSLGLAIRLDETPTVVGETAFYGLDHVPVSQREELTYNFEPHDVDTAVLVAHGLFEPFAHADWDTETVLTESSVDFDAMLLGDNHKPDQAEVADTWVTYPGSTERASASEEAGRGYNLVTFGEAAVGEDRVDVRRRALDTRPFAFVSVDLRDGEGPERVREQVRQHDLEGAVVIVEVTGDGEPVTPAAIEEFAMDQGALIARVKDRREVETEADLDVSFADPEDAVRERVTEMGLSTAALDVDETIRASKVADSNVREEVKTRLEDRLADEDLAAFETGSGMITSEVEQTDAEQTDAEQTDAEQTDAEQTDAEQTDAEQTDAEQTDAEQSEETQKPMDSEENGESEETGSEPSSEGESTTEDAEATTEDAKATTGNAEATTENAEAPTEDAETPADDAGNDTDDSQSRSEADTQPTMEDFL